MIYQKDFRGNNNNPFSSLLSIIIFVLALVGLFILAKAIFNILYYLSPLVIIATAIIDYKVIVNYAQWVIGLFRQNILLAVGATVLTFLMFPVVAIFLLGKALFNKKVRQVEEEQRRLREGEFADFEEIVDDMPLKLPRNEKKTETPERKNRNQYDDLFS